MSQASSLLVRSSASVHDANDSVLEGPEEEQRRTDLRVGRPLAVIDVQGEAVGVEDLYQLPAQVWRRLGLAERCEGRQRRLWRSRDTSNIAYFSRIFP